MLNPFYQESEVKSGGFKKEMIRLRIVDIADLLRSNEVGYYIPEPIAGNVSPMSNEVDTDSQRIVFSWTNFQDSIFLSLTTGK